MSRKRIDKNKCTKAYRVMTTDPLAFAGAL